jgi:hypothetical protein
VSSSFANQPYYLGDLPNLLAIKGRKASLYTIHSASVTKADPGFLLCESSLSFLPQEFLPY